MSYKNSQRPLVRARNNLRPRAVADRGPGVVIFGMVLIAYILGMIFLVVHYGL